MMALSPRPGAEGATGESSRGRASSSSYPGVIPIQGSLADWPLAEVVQFLHRTRQTGELALERGEPAQTASVSLHQGRIEDARCRPLVGDEAVYALLGWHHGRFLFLAGTIARPRTVHAELRTLLLEGARRRDELDRMLGRLPPGGTRLHQVHESATAGARISRLAWNLLSHVDGTRTVLDLVESRPGCEVELAEALVDLVEVGLVVTAPDTAFVTEVAVRRLVEPTGAAPLVDAILARAEAAVTLADLAAGIGWVEEDVLRCVTGLVDAHWLEVCAGDELYVRHLGFAIPPRL